MLISHPNDDHCHSHYHNHCQSFFLPFCPYDTQSNLRTFPIIALKSSIPSIHSSTNHLEACAALSAVCKVVNADMIPAIIKDVSHAPCQFHILQMSPSACVVLMLVLCSSCAPYSAPACVAVVSWGQVIEWVKPIEVVITDWCSIVIKTDNAINGNR